MNKLLVVVLACVVGVLGSVAYAESKPFQASLTPDIAIHSKSTHINGVALSIWGQNSQNAFAFGFVNGSTGDSAGFSLGWLNYAERYTGVEWGVVNYSSGHFKGWQNGFINYAGKLTGLQLGFVNYAGTADTGLQIGFANIIKQNAWFSGFPDELAKGMVFINWRF